MTNPTTRIVDMRIPLTWLITTGGAILVVLASTLWAVAGQSNDLKLLLTASAKMEKRMDDSGAKADARTDEMRDRLSNMDRTTDNLKLRVDALERVRK